MVGFCPEQKPGFARFARFCNRNTLENIEGATPSRLRQTDDLLPSVGADVGGNP